MTVNELIAEINKIDDITATVVNGQLQITASGDVERFEVVNEDTNIVTQLGIGVMDPNTKQATSEVINYHQTIGEGTPGSEDAQNFTSVSINENGLIEVKYGNNDTLSVMQDPHDPSKMILKYTLNDGTVITGSDLTVNDQLVEPANLQIQMASFVNPQGLTAQGNNTYSNAPNAGMVLYGSISSAAFGNVKSGVLEGSNVDLASEFADMVVSQRAIEANSRVFTTTNEILQTLSNLGR